MNPAEPAGSTGGCPYGGPECDGPSGLYFGMLSCWDCFRDAPASAVLAYLDAEAYASTAADRGRRQKEDIDDVFARLDRRPQVDDLLDDLDRRRRRVTDEVLP